MSSVSASPYARPGRLHSRPGLQAWPSERPAAAHAASRAGPQLRRYLPLVVLTTALVTALPAVLAAAIVPRASPLLMALSAISAVAGSIAIATAGAALWKRQPGARDILFADLLIWGWLRRCWTEWRLSRAHERYESARRAGPTVSIDLLTGLGRLLEARDAYTHRHGQRVARHAVRIARGMHLASPEVAKIRAAAEVHDVGKLYTPREILNNPGRLTDSEFAVIKRHASDGADMLEGAADPEITAMVRHHHERMDGRGYPAGLAGADIPLGARIIAVADTFDAITSSRAYRGAKPQKKALEVLDKGAGTQLDSVAVAAFRDRYSGRRSVTLLAVATAVSERAVALVSGAFQGFGAAGAVSSLLPALGAAGLVSLSPALHHHTPLPTKAQRPAALTHHATVPAASTTPALRQGILQTRSGRPAPPARRIGSAAPLMAPTNHAASTPIAVAGETKPGRVESTGSSPTHTATSPPAPTQPLTVPQLPPSTVPQGTVPPVTVPTLPPPPVSPPITLPTVPTVSTPPVSLPPIHVPGPAAPSAEAPTLHIPSLG